MDYEIETFNFSLKTLEDVIKSIECFNYNLDTNIKEKNCIVIDKIKKNISELYNNISDIKEKKNNNRNLDDVTKILRDTIKKECQRIYKFSSYIDISEDSNLIIIKKYGDQIYKLVDQIKLQINDLDLTCLVNDNVITIIKDKISENKIQLDLIKEETDEILKKNLNQLFESNELKKYCSFLDAKVDKSKNIIYEIRAFKENNKNDLTVDDNYVIDSLINIVDNQIYTLNNLNMNLEKLLSYDIEDLENKNEELKKCEDYKTNLIKTFEELYNNNASDDEIINTLLDLYDKEHNKDSNVVEIIEVDNVDEKQKEIDIKSYKEKFSALNKSFWEARDLVSQEKVKYPSALFEKKVKEYQNNFLIENYNISLEGLENEIEEYKKKYAADLYMDKIYDEAIYQLKEETLSTLDEICDESDGLSILDCRALDILNEDLMDVIRKLRKVKQEEFLDGFIDIEEYRKSVRMSNLMDKKEMIERQIFIIQNKRRKLEGLD